ncbi:unnamed protein product, partial [Mesorhabditis belari]|uniref:Uncharacterized protein n=1 Tax=Mesorhabditis belari TaxID=2138241 RepID=A0AAF3F1R0_9BILA
MGLVIAGILYFSFRLVSRYFTMLQLCFNWSAIFASYPWGHVINPIETEVMLLGFNLFVFICCQTIIVFWEDNWRFYREMKAFRRWGRLKNRTIDYFSDVVMGEMGELICFWLLNAFLVVQSALLYLICDVYYKEPFASMYINVKKAALSLNTSVPLATDADHIVLQPMHASVAAHGDSMLSWLWHDWTLVLQQLAIATYFMTLNRRTSFRRKLLPFSIAAITTFQRCGYWFDSWQRKKIYL